MWTRPLIRNVSILAGCQAMFFMANTILISTSALVGLRLAPIEMLATLPIGIQFLGSMLTTLPASYLMRRIGRSRGLALGALFGVVAGGLAALAVIISSFVLFILASLLYGCFSAFCQFYRFTAADAADAAAASSKARGQAISLVLAGGVVAAIVGPELAKLSQHMIPDALFAGCYVVIVALALLSTLALRAMDLPHRPANETTGEVRSTLEIFRQPTALTALLSAIVAYVTMNLLMTATPLAMHNAGLMFESTAFVIQWHVVGMFAPSFFTGALITRFGEGRMIAAGAVLLIVAAGVNLTGLALANFTIGLLFLGIGWNFMFIGATTLLTRCYRPAEKAKAQGVNDLLLFSAVTLSAMSSGALHQLSGWHVMNVAVLPVLAICLVLTVLRPLKVAGQAA